MVVMIVKNIKKYDTGEIKNTLMEVSPGIFVGNCSKVIRELLWDYVVKKSSSVLMIFSSNNVQGFDVKTHGLFGTKIKRIANMYFSTR